MKRESENGLQGPIPSRKSSPSGSKGSRKPMEDSPSRKPGRPAKLGYQVPVVQKSDLGEGYHQQCTVSGHLFFGAYGKHVSCPECGHSEYFSPPAPMPRQLFATYAVRTQLMENPAIARKLLDVDITEYDRHDFTAGMVSDDLARKMTSLVFRKGPLNFGESAPKGPNTKFGVHTPLGAFPTINAAAAAYGISYPRALRLATHGLDGWSKVLLVAGRMP